VFGLPAYAGWSSGGGGLLKSSTNPWFLNNTASAKYCVQIDEENFGASEAFINPIIERAFEYWREQFKFARLQGLKSFGSIHIATQVFKKVSCEESVDVVFQFGVLNQTQKDYLKDPKQYGAISVRTEYSEENLRGKGFIYISPAKGSLGIDLNTAGHDMWTKASGARLYLALLHELGHVFGLPHVGSTGLMAEGFVEKVLLDDENPGKWIDDTKLFFKLPMENDTFCLEGPLKKMWKGWADVLGLSEEQKCLKLTFEHADDQLNGATVVSFFAGPNPESLSKIGISKLKTILSLPTHLVTIWLPDDQKVFLQSDIELLRFKSLLGPSTWSTRKIGYFKSVDGKTVQSLIVTFAQGESLVTIDGAGKSGKIVPLVLLGSYK